MFFFVGRPGSVRPPWLSPPGRKLARSFLSVVARSFSLSLAIRSYYALSGRAWPSPSLRLPPPVPYVSPRPPAVTPRRCFLLSCHSSTEPIRPRSLGLPMTDSAPRYRFLVACKTGKTFLVGKRRSQRNFRFASDSKNSEKLLIRAQTLGGHGYRSQTTRVIYFLACGLLLPPDGLRPASLRCKTVAYIVYSPCFAGLRCTDSAHCSVTATEQLTSLWEVLGL